MQQMSKKEYKRLGDYIREVNVRNRDLAVSNLLGVSIQKTFIKSIANTIGTDMSTYKIVLRGQFAYGPVTSRNGDKVSIALLSDDENAIISQAYAVFEVIDRSKLLPEYLMMWFRRPEFDRYARFKSHGSAREVFDWDEMCNVTLPIPAIEVQRKIVAEYEAISKRIALNETICKKLEDTAQAIYRKMFVDDIDPENLPDGWRMGMLGEICEVNTCNKRSLETRLKSIRYLDSSSITNNRIGQYQTFNSPFIDIPSRAQRTVQNGDIIYSTVRPNLNHHGIIREKCCKDILVSTAFAVIRSVSIDFSNELIYFILKDISTINYLQSIAELSKATYPSIVVDDIMNIKNPLPETMNKKQICAQKSLSLILEHLNNLITQNKIFEDTQSIILSKFLKD